MIAMIEASVRNQWIARIDRIAQTVTIGMIAEIAGIGENGVATGGTGTIAATVGSAKIVARVANARNSVIGWKQPGPSRFPKTKS